MARGSKLPRFPVRSPYCGTREPARPRLPLPRSATPASVQPLAPDMTMLACLGPLLRLTPPPRQSGPAKAPHTAGIPDNHTRLRRTPTCEASSAFVPAHFPPPQPPGAPDTHSALPLVKFPVLCSSPRSWEPLFAHAVPSAGNVPPVSK